jgi:hypothetical protein
MHTSSYDDPMITAPNYRVSYNYTLNMRLLYYSVGLGCDIPRIGIGLFLGHLTASLYDLSCT